MKTLIAIAIAAFSLGAMAQGHGHEGGHEGHGPGREAHGGEMHREGPEHHWDQGQFDRAHNWQEGRHWHDGRFHDGPPHFDPRHRGHWEWRGGRRVWIIVDETCVQPDWDFAGPVCLEWAPF